MHLHGILGSLAPLVLLTITCITISTATHPLAALAANTLTPTPPLTKRTNHVTLSGMTLRGSQPLGLILPIQIAASQFEGFYTGLYHAALAMLAQNHPNVGSFTLRHEAFEINFVTSDEGQGQWQGQGQGVPWDFVRDFAVLMRIMSLRGYTGCYDQGYWNEVGDFGIYVGLRILVAPLSS